MKNVLVVDDSQFMRMSIKKMLIKHGYDVVGEAENGMEAIEKYKELSPDLVTLDVTMDKMSGVETLQKIMEYDREAIVFMLSALGQEKIIQNAQNLGAKGFLAKPLNESVVIDTITKVFKA